MRCNNKGQALIEFVLILPVLIFLVFLIIDFGRIMYTRNHLETKATDIIDLVLVNNDYDTLVKLINKDNPYEIKLSLDYDSNHYVTVYLDAEIRLMTPGLNLILGDPYQVRVKRVALYE